MVRFRQTGLLPKVDDAEFEWSRPDFPGSDDPLANAVEWIGDIATQMHAVWPAFVDGHSFIPPLEHVLDTLTRQRVAGDRPEVDAALMLHCQAGTVGVVDTLPACDFCGEPARYDAPAGSRENAPWGNMCLAHYRMHSTGRLGSGEGQYLYMIDEIPPDLTAALESAVEYWTQWRM